MTIQANIEKILETIDARCRLCHRNPAEVRLVAVSKKKSPGRIAEAYAAGQRLFGESYVQEFTQKFDTLGEPVVWHFIGALQTNKVKYLRGKTGLIHSVDRLSLAEEISRQWQKIDAVADILLQVHLGGEDTKSGVPENQLEALVRQVAVLPGVRVRGLMTLPPYKEDPEEVRPYFNRLRLLSQQIDSLNLPTVSMQELSMGMSHDFEVAIEEGATLVRVGTAIFGQRD